MISYLAPLMEVVAEVDPLQYDPTKSNISIGGFAMRRDKRDGRNPSTGARTSKKYGLSIGFLTGLNPLSNSDNQPIY